jgi:multicomponent Na+:H+ antiporter subunit B
MPEMEFTILRIASRFVIPLQLALAIFLLLRGHNEPGGGFIAGLTAASALVLYAFAFPHGAATVRRRLRFSLETWMAVGLFLALISGLGGALTGAPYLTSLWGGAIPLPFLGKIKLGTPLIFDIGVFLLVFAVTVQIFLSLFESPEDTSPGKDLRS